MENRFLLVQLADIGDLVLTTPAIDALREAHPDAHLTLLTTLHAAPVVDGANLVDEVITFDKHAFDSPAALLKPSNLSAALKLAGRLRRGKFDTTVFFHHFTTRFGALKFWAMAMAAGSRRRVGLDNGSGGFLTLRLVDEGFGAWHQAQYWLNLVALLDADSGIRPARISSSAGLKPAATNKRRIVIHPGSGGYSTARRWDAGKFAAVADALHAEYDAEITLVGTSRDNTAAVREAMQAPATDLTDQLTLPELAGLLQESDLFIGADSGVMHMAAAVGCPLVTVFGPSNPDAWGPWAPDAQAVTVRSKPFCSPCSYVRHTVGLRHGCEARTCMRMVTPEDVLTAARGLLEEDDILALSIDASVSTPVDPITISYPPRIRILDVPVSVITYDKWFELIAAWVAHGERMHHVCTTNPEFIMIARQDVNFYNILLRADLCIPDGVALLWAAKRYGEHLPERVTGSDGVPLIAENAAKHGWKLFFLGAAPGVAEKAADVLREKHPALQIVGTYSGSPAWEEEDAIVQRVNASGADILFVAYGAPKQDKWIARNAPRLKVKMAMGVGGTFDFIAGVVPRAPLWMRERGLEWLFRLVRQPWRVFRMTRLPRFVVAVLRDANPTD